VQSDAKSDLYRKLPSIDELLHRPELRPLIADEGQAAVTDAARTVLGAVREEIASGHLNDDAAVHLALAGIADAVSRQLHSNLRPSLRTVTNATGVILHTNLGRSPLAESALDHIRGTAAGYSNLEFDLETGDRGKRDVHVDRLFRRLLNRDIENPEEISTIVVNNNAAAVLLALNTFAEGGEVIVSRGELVEIGGSFRIPDVMAKSNAILREVGTTNRTRIADYERAVNERTRLLLRVHRSNFEISGFTERPELRDLVALARERKLPLMEDLGSGALFDLRSVGISGEPTIVESLRAGVDVVTYSGDKLLGGPQGGLLSGRPELIARARSNSLFRALRVDKLTYAALEATLLAYVRQSYDAIPTLHMMRLTKGEIAARADALAALAPAELRVELRDGESLIGGGSAPSASLPTLLLAISSKDFTADQLATRLRESDPPIIARVEDGRVLLDLRTVFPEQDALIASALAMICQS
jgi:L-seryl-tRNA(Ser) seleniumtransferase